MISLLLLEIVAGVEVLLVMAPHRSYNGLNVPLFRPVKQDLVSVADCECLADISFPLTRGAVF